MRRSIAGQLASLEYFSEGLTSFKLSDDAHFNLVVNCVCAQVPDAVPGWCVGVSILPVLCEDQETVGSLIATGEKWSINCQSAEYFGVKRDAAWFTLS